MPAKKKKRRKKHRSMVSLSKTLMSAIESAARRGKSWRTDKRVETVYKAVRKKQQAIEDARERRS
jgi:hypothetical protein